MANSEHLRILQQGVEVWNKWRNDNKGIIPDLYNAKLREKDLIGANFSNALLSKAELYNSDIRNANLSGANLRNAKIFGSDLSDADLQKADLRGCNLSGSDFINADLRETNLSESNLSESNFSGAKLGRANFNNAYLINADLIGADLFEAELHESNLNKAKLCGADIREADLYNADLSNADLSDADLSGANLFGATLFKADLRNAVFFSADLSEVDLSEANLTGADLTGADLIGANLRGADLSGANLSGANLSGADLSISDLEKKRTLLSNTDLRKAICIETNFTGANLENAKVYGISIWDIKTDGLKQENLIITTADEPVVTVDNLEVAQFIYLMLNNEKIRDVLGTISKKGVLILGRFTPERKQVLDAIREKLRGYDFVPMMFDFEKVQTRDFTETIKILAGLSRFVIADISEPKSSPLELQATIPDYQIPFLSIIQKGEKPFSMFNDLGKYPWVLETIEYDSEIQLMEHFKKVIIDRALVRETEIFERKLHSDNPIKNIRDLI